MYWVILALAATSALFSFLFPELIWPDYYSLAAFLFMGTLLIITFVNRRRKEAKKTGYPE